MLFGFFLRTNKTFRLTNKTHPLKSFPQLCSNGSKTYPHIIPPVNQVIPQIISLTGNLSNIPLFIAGKIDSNNTLSVLDPITNKNSSFCLVFYPNPQDPPLKGVEVQNKPIIREYWTLIRPMLICRDMSGFYLGSPEDYNIVLFEQCAPNEADCSIFKITSGYSESTMLTDENPIFSNIPLNLKKINKASTV